MRNWSLLLGLRGDYQQDQASPGPKGCTRWIASNASDKYDTKCYVQSSRCPRYCPGLWKHRQSAGIVETIAELHNSPVSHRKHMGRKVQGMFRITHADIHVLQIRYTGYVVPRIALRVVGA
jgi:hypothetical protein